MRTNHPAQERLLVSLWAALDRGQAFLDQHTGCGPEPINCPCHNLEGIATP